MASALDARCLLRQHSISHSLRHTNVATRHKLLANHMSLPLKNSSMALISLFAIQQDSCAVLQTYPFIYNQTIDWESERACTRETERHRGGEMVMKVGRIAMVNYEVSQRDNNSLPKQNKHRQCVNPANPHPRQYLQHAGQVVCPHDRRVTGASFWPLATGFQHVPCIR